MKIEFWACIEGLLIYRLAYQRVRSRNPNYFPGSLAQIVLDSVEAELDDRLMAIDLSDEIADLEGIQLLKSGN